MAAGFKKIWVVLPRTALQQVSKLAGIPSMPRSLGASLGFIAWHSLGDTVGLLGIDYRNRTVNVYFGEPPAEGIAEEFVRAMLRETGHAEPTEQMLKLGRQAFGVYVTLNWDSPKIERICFTVATPIPAVASQPEDEYYKLQSYYRWGSGIPEIMQLPEGALADPV